MFTINSFEESSKNRLRTADLVKCNDIRDLLRAFINSFAKKVSCTPFISRQSMAVLHYIDSGSIYCEPINTTLTNLQYGAFVIAKYYILSVFATSYNGVVNSVSRSRVRVSTNLTCFGPYNISN